MRMAHRIGGVVLLAVGAALLSTTSAFAQSDNDSNFGEGVNSANNWNFTAADVCAQELAVAPALSDWTGNQKNNCSNGNVIDHSGSGTVSPV